MKLKLLFALLILQISFAQQRVCPSVERHNLLMQTNAEYAAKKNALKELVKNEIVKINSGRYNRSTNVIKIPPVKFLTTKFKYPAYCGS